MPRRKMTEFERRIAATKLTDVELAARVAHPRVDRFFIASIRRGKLPRAKRGRLYATEDPRYHALALAIGAEDIDELLELTEHEQGKETVRIKFTINGTDVKVNSWKGEAFYFDLEKFQIEIRIKQKT